MVVAEVKNRQIKKVAFFSLVRRRNTDSEVDW